MRWRSPPHNRDGTFHPAITNSVDLSKDGIKNVLTEAKNEEKIMMKLAQHTKVVKAQKVAKHEQMELKAEANHLMGK